MEGEDTVVHPVLGEGMAISTQLENEMARTWNLDGDSFIESETVKNTDFRAVKYDGSEGESTKYFCNICNNEFAQVGSVKRHITKQHMRKKQECKEPTELQEIVSGKRSRGSPNPEEKEDKRLKAVKETFDMDRVKKFLDTTPFATSTQIPPEENENSLVEMDEGKDGRVVANDEVEYLKKTNEDLIDKTAKLQDEAKVQDGKIKSLEEAIATNRQLTMVAQAEKENIQIYVTEKEKENKLLQEAFVKMEKELEVVKKGKSSKESEEKLKEAKKDMKSKEKSVEEANKKLKEIETKLKEETTLKNAAEIKLEKANKLVETLTALLDERKKYQTREGERVQQRKSKSSERRRTRSKSRERRQARTKSRERKRTKSKSRERKRTNSKSRERNRTKGKSRERRSRSQEKKMDCHFWLENRCKFEKERRCKMGIHDLARKGLRSKRMDRKRDKSQEQMSRRRSQERRQDVRRSKSKGKRSTRSQEKRSARSQEKRSRSKDRRRSCSKERKGDCPYWLEGICRYEGENECRKGAHEHSKKGSRSRRPVMGQQQGGLQQQQYFGQPLADTFLSQGSANRVNEARNQFYPMQSGQPMMMMVPAGPQMMPMAQGPVGGHLVHRR